MDSLRKRCTLQLLSVAGPTSDSQATLLLPRIQRENCEIRDRHPRLTTPSETRIQSGTVAVGDLVRRLEPVDPKLPRQVTPIR